MTTSPRVAHLEILHNALEIFINIILGEKLRWFGKEKKRKDFSLNTRHLKIAYLVKKKNRLSQRKYILG